MVHLVDRMIKEMIVLDKEFIEFSQQFPSRLCKRTTMVLRQFEKGFIACKFSAFAYLLIGILWLDRSKSKEEKQQSNRKSKMKTKKI